MRKLKEGEVETDSYAFLTCSPNAEVGAIHPKGMLVILTKREELELWMTGVVERSRVTATSAGRWSVEDRRPR